MTTGQAVAESSLKIKGHGLISGLPVEVEIERAPQGQGIVFVLEPEVKIRARLESVVQTDRGVTLGHPSGKTLSIVEHFLCASALAGLSDLTVKISGAPELPILDGSAAQWLEALNTHFERRRREPAAANTPGQERRKAKLLPDLHLGQAVFLRQDETACVYALPSTHFQVSYSVDFGHPDLTDRWVHWDSLSEEVDVICQARTFGHLRELPALQAQGLAKGVSPENTVGLTDDGGYTDELRIEDEPVRHKILDLIGDMALTGLNPLRLRAHIYAINAGHTSHTRFARKMLDSIRNSHP